MKSNQKFLLGITIWTWIVGSIIGVLFLFIMLHDLSGIEWFGSPTFGMVILVLLMTSFYLIFRKKSIQPSLLIVIWFVFLFVATTISMIALAYANFGAWEDFQTMPLMGTFHLILWALGVHLSYKKVPKKQLYLFTLWTAELFLTTLFTMIALAYGPFGMWEDWQPYPILGTGIWIGILTIIYFVIRTPTISWIDAGFYWSWTMFVGITTSMLSVYIVLINFAFLWPFFPIIGTFSVAALFTLLKFLVGKKAKI